MTIPLILAIEPSKAHAKQLASLVRQHLDAELVTAPSAEAGLQAIGDRIPDLILTPALLGLRDEAALTERLRGLGTAASHVQTLAVPILAAAAPRQANGSLLGRKPRSDAADAVGCEPSVFADQIRIYLERAASERTTQPGAAAVPDPPAPAGCGPGSAEAGAGCGPGVPVVSEPPAPAVPVVPEPEPEPEPARHVETAEPRLPDDAQEAPSLLLVDAEDAAVLQASSLDAPPLPVVEPPVLPVHAAPQVMKPVDSPPPPAVVVVTPPPDPPPVHRPRKPGMATRAAEMELGLLSTSPGRPPLWKVAESIEEFYNGTEAFDGTEEAADVLDPLSSAATLPSATAGPERVAAIVEDGDDVGDRDGTENGTQDSDENGDEDGEEIVLELDEVPSLDDPDDEFVILVAADLEAEAVVDGGLVAEAAREVEAAAEIDVAPEVDAASEVDAAPAAARVTIEDAAVPARTEAAASVPEPPVTPASRVPPAPAARAKKPPAPPLEDWAYFDPSQSAFKALVRRLDEIAGHTGAGR